MSRAYLDDHLFRAFSQENSLTEGTGLGMNLVAKIGRWYSDCGRSYMACMANI